MTLLHQAAQKAVEAVPRFRWDQDMDVLAGPYPDGEWVRHADVIAALQQQPEPVAPFWYAVVSDEAPIINKAIRRADVAEEYAQNCRENGYTRVQVVQLYTAPPALQHQEVPREPVAKDVRVSDFIAGAAWHMANPDESLDALQEAAEWWATEHASPSTTRQQEVGSVRTGVTIKLVRAPNGETLRMPERNESCNCAARRTLCDGINCVRPGAAPSTPEKAGGVPVARTYLHASRVDALIAVMEGECDGLAVTRETAEAILHYLDGNAPPVGVKVLREGEPQPPAGPAVPACPVCVGCREWGGNGLWHHAGCQGQPARLERAPGVSASVPHPLPAQANDGGEHG